MNSRVFFSGFLKGHFERTNCFMKISFSLAGIDCLGAQGKKDWISWTSWKERRGAKLVWLVDPREKGGITWLNKSSVASASHAIKRFPSAMGSRVEATIEEGLFATMVE